jgi:hypothetical protein
VPDRFAVPLIGTLPFGRKPRFASDLVKIKVCPPSWRKRWKKSPPSPLKIRMRLHPRSSRRWVTKRLGSPFTEKREVIRRMAREALDEDETGKTLLLDDLL